MTPSGPVVIRAQSGMLHGSPAIANLVRDVRQEVDAFLFLAGGASRMPPSTQSRLVDLVQAIPDVADRGVRVCVADGGTRAGLMEAAGLARAGAREPFPLIGIAPAAEITSANEPGKTAIDPNHSCIVAVDNPLWVEARRREGWTPEDGHWGCEIEVMADLFDELSRGRPSVAVLANGGDTALREVRMHLDAGRRVILIEGSGRAADALVSLLRGTAVDGDEMNALRRTAASLGLLARPTLYTVVTLSDGAPALTDALFRYLARV
jgi:hypothetical protein